jgi:hypothetical protein
MEVYIDRTPPNATVVSGPPLGQLSPSKVSLAFAGQSGGVIGAPVNNFQCLLTEGNQVRDSCANCIVVIVAIIRVPTEHQHIGWRSSKNAVIGLDHEQCVHLRLLCINRVLGSSHGQHLCSPSTFFCSCSLLPW